MINKPTRVTHHSATLIDNILTNEFSVNNHHHQGIIYSDISDHFSIFHINESLQNKETQDACKWKRAINATRIAKFSEEIHSVDWNKIIELQDAQICYTEFHNIFACIYERHFPLIKVKSRYKNRKPWLTAELKTSINKKNKLHVKQKKFPTDINITLYKRFRNRVNKQVHDAERNHYHNLLIEHKSNLKQSWIILKRIINKNKTKIVTKEFKYHDLLLSDQQTISDKFNDFFINIGPNLANKIPVSKKSPVSYLHKKVLESFYLSPSTEEEILKIILNLKNSASGWDGFQAIVIKEIKSAIVHPIMHLCNLSFATGVFPKELKLAYVVPLFKSGDDMLFTNYRPVSILPLISKILERLMYNRLLNFLNKHNVIYDYQFGFRQKFATYIWLFLH